MKRIVEACVVVALLGIASVATPQVNLMGVPTYGTYVLQAGFAPDPQSVVVNAGGAVHTSSLQNCLPGYIPMVPSVRIQYTAGNLPLRFYVQSPGVDSMLAVNGPDGRWYCNDDTNGLEPVVDFSRPQSGQYDIFVGTFSQSIMAPVTLFVTEMPSVNGSSGSVVAVPQQNSQNSPTYWQPAVPAPGTTVTIFYNTVSGTLPDYPASVYLHLGFNDWQQVQDYVMVPQGNGWWSYTYFVPTSATVIDFAFTDGRDNWDNNGGYEVDWHIGVNK